MLCRNWICDFVHCMLSMWLQVLWEFRILSHWSWRSIFLLFSRQPNKILNSNFLLFSLRLGIFLLLLFFYFSRFHCFKNLFLISLFLLGLEFFPHTIICLEDFELLWYLFLNLKCHVKIEFVVLCIACFQYDSKILVRGFKPKILWISWDLKNQQTNIFRTLLPLNGQLWRNNH